MGDSLKIKSCFNCNDSSSVKLMNGWKDSTGEYVQLCYNCCSIYKAGQFCEMFHSDEDGWRDCESCKQLIHCGCIVSLSDYMMHDSGGITCNECSDTNSLLGRDCSNDESHSTDVADLANDTDSVEMTSIKENSEMDTEISELEGGQISDAVITEIKGLEMKCSSSWNNYSMVNKNKPRDKVISAWNQMSDDQKNAFAGPPKEEEPVRLRCCLSEFSKLVDKYELDSCQELADSPFIFLLNLKGYELDINLIKNLVDGFNVEDRSVMVDGKRVVLKLDDFEHILKIGNKDFPKTQRRKRKRGVPSTDFNAELFLGKEAKRNNTVSMTSLKDMLGKKENVDDFKRAFALICLRYIVCANFDGKQRKSVLKYVENVDDLKNQPWAGLAMKYLVSGIKSYRDSTVEDKKYIGGSMVFLQLYYLNKSTNKEPEVLISEITKSSVMFDDEIMSKIQVHGNGNRIGNLYDILKHDYVFCCDNFQVLAEDLDEGDEEKDESDEDMEEEEEVDEGVHERVGPFRIRKTIISSADRDFLKRYFEDGDDSTTLAAIEDAKAFDITKGLFFKNLRPAGWVSNMLVSYVTQVLNIRQISKRPVKRWYVSPDHMNFRIDSGRSKVKHKITSTELKLVKQIFFPLIEKKHWYLIVFDTEKKNVEIWDTLKKKDINLYETTIKKLSWFLSEQTKDKEKVFSQYACTLVDVPQQTGCDDCGIYVCRYMEFPDDVMRFKKEEWNSEEERCCLAVRILRAQENSITRNNIDQL